MKDSTINDFVLRAFVASKLLTKSFQISGQNYQELLESINELGVAQVRDLTFQKLESNDEARQKIINQRLTPQLNDDTQQYFKSRVIDVVTSPQLPILSKVLVKIVQRMIELVPYCAEIYRQLGTASNEELVHFFLKELPVEMLDVIGPLIQSWHSQGLILSVTSKDNILILKPNTHYLVKRFFQYDWKVLQVRYALCEVLKKDPRCNLSVQASMAKQTRGIVFHGLFELSQGELLWVHIDDALKIDSKHLLSYHNIAKMVGIPPERCIAIFENAESKSLDAISSNIGMTALKFYGMYDAVFAHVNTHLSQYIVQNQESTNLTLPVEVNQRIVV